MPEIGELFPIRYVKFGKAKDRKPNRWKKRFSGKRIPTVDIGATVWFGGGDDAGP